MGMGEGERGRCLLLSWHGSCFAVVQGLVHRFTSAVEETKRELELVSSDMDASFSLQLATKLSSEDLPQKLQDASLVSRATLQAHMKQVCPIPPLQTL